MMFLVMKMNDLSKLTTSTNRQVLLESMGLHTLEDVYMHLPYRYDEIKEIWPGGNDGKICVEGHIISTPKIFFKGRFSRLSVKVKIKEEEYNVVIFNRHFLRPHLKMGVVVTIMGKLSDHAITASTMLTKSLDEMGGIYPIYSLKEGITDKQFQKYVNKALMLSASHIVDFTPSEFKEKYHYMNKKDALYEVHNPTQKERIVASLKSLKYEEFLKFQLTMQYIRIQRENEAGEAKVFSHQEINAFLKTLPYHLTKDQQEATKAILRDLEKPTIMYRFLQGDVGSGKTVVSSIGLYANYLAGYQGALMAPTEVLATQHYRTLTQFFKNADIKIALLVGALTPNKKEEIYQALAQGDIDIVVGTHALFQAKVRYKRLGLVITDEQHRFGVKQRKALKDKGKAVDFLVMSATPIPRTLALSLYGDMDVSTIHTMPSGRKPVITKYFQSASMKPFLKELKDYLKAGGQVYVICPAIEDNEDYQMTSAIKIAQGMAKYFEPHYHVGLLHGGLSDQDKNRVMDEFAANKIQILVSTTVIEVGIDVHNANFMVIYDAERFGMSQIHQLRGRVGRGSEQGYCYLLSKATNEEAIERLQFLESHNDGFEISRYDLETRGPGEVLGSRQSGLATFVIGDVFKDFDILEMARDDAIEMIESYYKYDEYQSYIQTIIENIKSANDYMD